MVLNHIVEQSKHKVSEDTDNCELCESAWYQYIVQLWILGFCIVYVLSICLKSTLLRIFLLHLSVYKIGNCNIMGFVLTVDYLLFCK